MLATFAYTVLLAGIYAGRKAFDAMKTQQV